MDDLSWIRPGHSSHQFNLNEPKSWKDRPIDLRAEAIAQVRPQRRSQLNARRGEEKRTSTRAGSGSRSWSDRAQEPEIRRVRKADASYPSRWYLWKGDAGRAYVRAWESYSWGLRTRPEPWCRFKSEFEG